MHIIDVCDRIEKNRIRTLSDQYNAQLSDLFGYEIELGELCELYSGRHGTETLAHKSLQINGIKPSSIEVKDLFHQLQTIRSLKTNSRDTTLDDFYTNNNLVNEYASVFLDEINSMIGRIYVLDYSNGFPLLLAKDETYQEQIKRRLRVDSGFEYLIPVFGQLLLICACWITVSKFIKKKRAK